MRDLQHHLRFKANFEKEVFDCEIGFFEKRNNKKRWIKNVDDLNNMYANHCPSDSLKLWCAEQDKPVDKETRTRKATQEKRLDKESRKDLESTLQELSDMHGKKYTEAQLRVWARLVVNGLHKDMDSPPNIPIISGEPVKKKSAPKENDSLTDVIKAAVSAFAEKLGSPSRSSTPPKAACGISPSTKANFSINKG